jgi:hypothetical protein
MINENEKNIAKLSIDDLLNISVPDEITGDSREGLFPEPPKIKSNFADLREKASEKAKKTLNSLLKLYLSEEIIEKEEYVKAKMNLDQMALSQLIYLMESGEKMITILMNSIEDGAVEARLFEVLGGLQRTQLDIIKSQTVYMLAIEDNAKKMNRDIDFYKPIVRQTANVESEGAITQAKGSGITTRGTKDLMKAIQAASHQNQEVEDVKEVEEKILNIDLDNLDHGFDEENDEE